MRRLSGWFQVRAACLWTRLSQNRPSAHDVPSYLEGPSVAHMAPVLGYDPSVGNGPTVETKTPPSVAFIHKLFLPLFLPKPVSSSVQTELSQQLHTPDAPSIGLGAFCLPEGQQAMGSCFRETLHHNGLPAFSEPPSILCDLTPSGFNGLRGAVDGAWEYLLFSCFCQQFGLKTTQNPQRCAVCKRRAGLTSVCDGAVLPLFNMQAACGVWELSDRPQIKVKVMSALRVQKNSNLEALIKLWGSARKAGTACATCQLHRKCNAASKTSDEVAKENF